MTTMLLHSLNEMHLKYVVHNKFRMIMPISMNQRTLSLNFKSSRSQCFSGLGFFKVLQVTIKYLCWSYFLIKLQACRSAILLKRDSRSGVFLWILPNFKNTYFEEHLQTAASVFWSVCANKQVAKFLRIPFLVFTEHLPTTALKFVQ